MKLKRMKGCKIVNNKYFPKEYISREMEYVNPCSLVHCDRCALNNYNYYIGHSSKKSVCRITQIREAKKLGIKLIKTKEII